MAYNGTVISDFMKLVTPDSRDREKYIDYTSGDFASFRTSMINYIKAVYPLDYNNFIESDFGVFLIELMASVGHIQSIKFDYLANENFLRTASDRESVKKLLELIGVRMKGPISAAANAKITIEDVPGGTTEVRIPVNNRVFSITSPEDGAIVTYTLYKVNPDGSVLLNDSTFDLEFTVTESGGSVVITDAIILEGSLVIESGQFLSQDLVKSVSLSNYPYVEKSAQVIIEGSETTQGVYTEEDNLYAASSGSDKIFQVITDDNYVPTILFGDSALGQAPATGDTYSISYRVGGGTRGNLAKEVINVPITVFVGEQDYTGTLENSGEATGGADAETVDHAKRYAPLTFRRQDRIVTLDDYKTFANTFASTYGSTGKANAIVRRAYSSANIIDIFVLEKASDTQLRRATTEYKRQLLEAMQQKKMLTDEPVVVDGLIRTLELGVTISLERKYRNYEEEIKAQVSNKILEYFNVDNADFGQSFDPSDLIRFILELQKVRFAEINNIDSIIKINFNEIIQLNNFSITVTYI